MKFLLKLAIFGWLFLSQFVSPANCQEAIRWIHESKNSFPNAPIKIVDREIMGKSFSGYGMAGDDWLEDLTFIVKNVSAKNIKRIEILLMIPQQGGMEANYGFLYLFDHRQAQKDENGGTISAAAATSSMLKPGETMKLTTYKPNALSMLKSAKEKGVFDIRNVDLWLMEVRFEDGTGKVGGSDAVEDADENLRIVKPSDKPIQLPSCLKSEKY